ncbi:MAG: 1,6-anhydro-N-acetylmuramyl-L-alanine amidase AmpD [Steroidobacteraceae bacterium]|jgi:AmpD protein
MRSTYSRLPALRIDLRRGLLCGAAFIESPNHDARPAGARPELIVVHGISLPPGEFGGPWIERLFTNSLPADAHPYFRTIADLRVAPHLLVRRDGSIAQFVSFRDRAWHAGKSRYRGRQACNDFSIGVELEGSDHRAYAGVQYRALAAIVEVLCGAYPGLSPRRVVGHSDIAPGRKTDPGPAFDWRRARRLISQRLARLSAATALRRRFRGAPGRAPARTADPTGGSGI